jgi:hypothetical protein
MGWQLPQTTQEALNPSHAHAKSDGCNVTNVKNSDEVTLELPIKKVDGKIKWICERRAAA